MKLYHATFKHHLESIKKYGLGGKITKRNHDISQEDVLVYLSSDYEECEIMMEESFDISEGKLTMDDVIILEVDEADLDPDYLYYDTNLEDTETSFEYYKVIPFDKLKIFIPPKH